MKQGLQPFPFSYGHNELGSTGVDRGVAVPHARLHEVEKPFALLARLKSPIEFDAVDGRPIDLVFLLLLPASFQLDQLNQHDRSLPDGDRRIDPLQEKTGRSLH